MSKSIRLISDEIIVHQPNLDNSELNSFKNYIFPAPTGKFLLLCFADLNQANWVEDILKYAVENDIGVVYLSESFPKNPIIDSHIIYLTASSRWFVHTLFMNPLRFKGVFGSPNLKRMILGFSQFTQYNIPVINQISDLTQLKDTVETAGDSVLVEIIGGVGDHLLATPTIKTLAESGKTVDLLVESHRVNVFDNLPYINKIYIKRNEINVAKYNEVIYLHYGQILNDYRMDYNKQNRIYSTAIVAGLSKNSLVRNRPEIILTKQEIEDARLKYGSYKNKIYFGYDSARVDAKIPNSLTQEVINELKKAGFTVFISSLRSAEFQNCINLTKKLSLREYFALIAVMDYVLTVDSSCLHVSGAFNKRTFCLINYFEPSWRTSTYKNCKVFTPTVDCYPCVSKQFVASNKWQCTSGKSCFEHFSWKNILNFIKYEKNKVNNKVKNEEITVVNHTKNKPISTNSEPVKDIQLLSGMKTMAHLNKKYSDIAALWMGGIGDAVMLGYLCRALKRKYSNSVITAIIRDFHQNQLFTFDAPNIRAFASNKNWRDTIKENKNLYDMVYEFNRAPMLWQKGVSKPLPENYTDWTQASETIKQNWDGTIWEYYAYKLGLELIGDDLRIPLRPLKKSTWIGYYKTKYKLPDNYITIHTGTDQGLGKMKTLEFDKVQAIAAGLKKAGYNVVQIIKDKDEKIDGVLHVDPHNLIDLMYILNRSYLHLDNEGGLVHLAHAVGSISLVWFGATSPKLYGYKDNINLYLHECPSCWWAKSDWSRVCMEGESICKNLAVVNTDWIIKKALDYLDGKK